MTVRDEVLKAFDDAHARIEARSPRAGTLPAEDHPDMRWVTINETNRAITDALLLLADRIDRLEQGTTALK